MPIRKILITGAAGFIGAHLTSRLKEQGYEVVGLDNFSNYYSVDYKISRIKALSVEKEISLVDINNHNELRKVFDMYQPKMVIHLAAQAGVRAVRLNPRPYLDTNQLGTLNLLNLCKEFSIKEFIYASSSSVYGDENPRPSCEIDPIGTPRNLYALSKISTEMLADLYKEDVSHNIGLRFFTVYGPWGRPDMFIQKLMANMLLKRTMPVYGQLDKVRDATFIDEILFTIQQLIESKEYRQKVMDQGNGILNIGGANPIRMSHILEKICEISNLVPDIDWQEVDPFDANITHACDHLAEQIGIPINHIDYKVGLRNTWDWISNANIFDLEKWFSVD